MKTTFLNIYKISLCVLAVSGVVSCSKGFLDVKPKGKVIVQTTTDYDLLMNQGGLISNNVDVGVPMGDEAIAFDNYFSTTATLRSQRLFRWDDVIYDEGVFAFEMSSLMANLYTYNKVINEVMSSSDGSDADKKVLLAEARANRAWIYFNLINLYGKPYNAATAATDPGYPIVTVADVTETNFTRASVQEVYDFILSDLTESIPNLPVTIRSRIRMGKAAAELLLGKVYVFMAKFDAAKPYLEAALTDLASTGAGSILTTMGLYDLNVTMISGGTWGWNPTTTATTSFNAMPVQQYYTEYIACRSSANAWSFSANECTMSPQATQLFTSSDKRLNFFTTKPYGVSTAYPLSGALRRNGPTSLQNGMTIPELYLLRAEVAARLGDTTTAIASLKTLRVKRMSTADANAIPTGMTQLQLIQFVLNERIREFAMQGYRWFDMRRLSVDPLFSSNNYTHTLYSATGTVSATYTLRPARFTLQFPLAVIAQNPAMENNP